MTDCPRCPECGERHETCQYDLDFDDESIKALAWLLDTCSKVHDKGGANAEKAFLAGRALVQLTAMHNFMHTRLHELDDALGLVFDDRMVN